MAVSVIQSTFSVEEGTVATATQAFTSAVSAGSTLVVAANAYCDNGIGVAPVISSVTDSAGNVYTRAGSQQRQGTSIYSPSTDIWYCTNVAAHAAPIVSATATLGTTWWYLSLWELTASQFDQAIGATGNSGTANGGSITPAANGAVFVGAWSCDQNATGWVAGSWTLLENTNAGGGQTASGQFVQAVAASFAISVGITSSTGFWTASGATFIPPQAPSAPAPQAPRGPRWFAGRAVVPSLYSGVRRAFVPLPVPLGTVPAAITASAVSVGGAATVLTAPALIVPSATAVGGASALVTAPALLSATAIAVGAATVVETAPALMTPTAIAVAGAACTVTAITGQALNPVAQAIGGASVALTAPAGLASSATAISSAVATTRAPSLLAAAATAVAGAAATTTAPVQLTLNAQVIAQAALALTVPGVVFLTPTAQAVAGAVCLLTAGAIPILPTAIAVASATTSLTAPAKLTPSASAVTASSGFVTAAALLSPQATATTQAIVTMLAPIQLQATAQALSSAGVVISVKVGLLANATVVGHAQCAVGFSGSLYPVAQAISGASATVTAAPYRKAHLLVALSSTYTLALGATSAYDLQIKASAARDEVVNTV